MTVLRSLVEDVALRADVADERHDEFFADRIDRRIRDLCEELLEVVEERLRAIGRQASGVSVPIDPTGSSPRAPMGPSTMRRSSSL